MTGMKGKKKSGSTKKLSCFGLTGTVCSMGVTHEPFLVCLSSLFCPQKVHSNSFMVGVPVVLLAHEQLLVKQLPLLAPSRGLCGQFRSS